MTDDGTKRPSIRALDNGPHLVTGLDSLSRKNGDPLPVGSTVALCRCDGQHEYVKFLHES
jgi:hypothetical protein